MVYVKEENVMELDKKYGPAKEIRIGPFPMLEWEWGVLKKSQRNGRIHDVTMFIEKSGMDDMFVCIQKPYYKNSGIYRAPSGGIEPGERIEDGLKREMLEETGLTVEIQKFILIIKTTFEAPDGKDKGEWVSYIFYGTDLSGDMVTQDPREIYEVKLCHKNEMLGDIADKMKVSGWGGFLYREMVTREALSEIASFAENK